MIWTQRHRATLGRSIRPWLVSMVAIAAVGGCTSDAERHAFDQWIRLDRDLYGGSDLTVASSPSSTFEDAGADLNDSPENGLPTDAQLADYVRYAAMHNPRLRAAFNQWKAALERVPQARSLPDPRFNYRYFIENVETRVGPQRQAFGLSQTFPWFGKLESTSSVALEAARMAQARYDAMKLQLFYDVKRGYYEYYYLARAIAVVEEDRNLVKYLEGVARARFKAAAGQHPDVIRAQVELGKLDDQLRSLQDLRGAQAARLNASLNRPTDAPIPWPKTIVEVTGKMDGTKLERTLKQANPQLRALQHEAAKYRKGIGLARKNYYPDITVGVDYIDIGDRSGADPPDNGQDAVAVGFSVNLPIWTEKYDAGVRESLARFGAATKMQADRQNILSADLKSAVYYYQDAIRKIDLFRDTLVPKAQQSLKATEASFRAGQSTFSDLIDAQRVLLQFQLSFERALTDGAIRLAQIEMLVGDGAKPQAAGTVDEDGKQNQDGARNEDKGENDVR